MNPCPAFDIATDGDPTARLRSLAGLVRELGGMLTGNRTRGNFSFPVPLSSRPVRGTYSASGASLRVQITDRPALLTCSLLEEVIKTGLERDSGPISEPPVTEFTIEVRFLGGLTPS